MVTYQYRCPLDGTVDVGRPMGTAPATWPCARCGNDMLRVFSAPMVPLGPRAVLAVIDRTERTRDEPVVVSAPSAIPAHRRMPTVSSNPVLQRLPRP